MTLHSERRRVDVLSCNFCNRRVDVPDGYEYFAPPLGWVELEVANPGYMGGGRHKVHACPDKTCREAAAIYRESHERAPVASPASPPPQDAPTTDPGMQYVETAIAWRDYAQHMERCRTCFNPIGFCDDGLELKRRAEENDAALTSEAPVVAPASPPTPASTWPHYQEHSWGECTVQLTSYGKRYSFPSRAEAEAFVAASDGPPAAGGAK